MITIQRAYDSPIEDKGKRYLVDRIWPRGIKKEDLALEAWEKEAAPSNELRRWFGHDPAKWDEFQRRYEVELDDHPAGWQPLLDAAKQGDIILVFGARDTEHNQAVALKSYLDAKLNG